MLRFLTAGESHGPQLTVIVEGLPAGLPLSGPRDIDPDLQRRQGGHGRGGRQKIEQDSAVISAGVRGGKTLGSPIALTVANRDWDNWKGPMQIEAAGFKRKAVTRVRPGHADLAGVLKYDFDDARDVLERASARETAARVAAGAVDTHCFAPVFGGAHVRDTHRVVVKGRVVYQGETLYSRDGVGLTFTYWNSLGGVGRGAVQTEATGLHFTGTMRTENVPAAMTATPYSSIHVPGSSAISSRSRNSSVRSAPTIMGGAKLKTILRAGSDQSGSWAARAFSAIV